ncbi:low-complexity tail membrane protein [Alkalinema sp. FACHB-956]|uniref:low-complexity tail membrane protein n=1 Tax=Alkalinema sp. FACHB-956 TaxID=2692768 RepID=UPI00168A1DD0|nr:low-complexity tail membrane protein [Alkalinema sp. FACHB-956]MBD2328547.1 low-complexity tail membrane protein [Alkalinema sp. FACHB-956]
MKINQFWLDPYLWIHLSGIVVVPIALLGCGIALASAPSSFSAIVEFLLIFVIGSLPIFWMQWQRPFYIYSILVIAIHPDALTPNQQKILSLFQTCRNPLLLLLGAIGLGVLLWQIQSWAALATAILPIPPVLRLPAAAIAFFLATLFLEVPLSVVQVMLAGEEHFAAAEPLTVPTIKQNFTIVGLKVNQILPTTPA